MLQSRSQGGLCDGWVTSSAPRIGVQYKFDSRQQLDQSRSRRHLVDHREMQEAGVGELFRGSSVFQLSNSKSDPRRNGELTPCLPAALLAPAAGSSVPIPAWDNLSLGCHLAHSPPFLPPPSVQPLSPPTFSEPLGTSTAISSSKSSDSLLGMFSICFMLILIKEFESEQTVRRRRPHKCEISKLFYLPQKSTCQFLPINLRL